MKNISSATENFIREQIEIKFKKQIDALKKKKTVLDKKRRELVDQTYKLDEQLSNVGELSDLQLDEVEALEEDLVDIIRKACAKTIADRLNQIHLKVMDEEKTIRSIVAFDGLFGAIDRKHVINTSSNHAKIKRQLQTLANRRAPISEECEKTEIEIEKIKEKIDKHVDDIIIRLELGGNYNDLMKMIDEIKI